MTKAPQIKAQALTAGLFHAHKPPLVPAYSALPFIQAIALPLSWQFLPASHTGHSAISLNGATLSLQSIAVQQQPIVINADLPYPWPAQ